MASAASPSLGIPSRPAYSCTRCADRKVKCDRQRPCGACVVRHEDCVSPPPRRRIKRVGHQVLIDRLRHYEELLQEQGIDPRKQPDSPPSESHRRSSHAASAAPEDSQLQTPSSADSEPCGCVNKTQVVQAQGRSMFVDNSLWARVVEEFHDPEDALDDFSDDASDTEASGDDFGFVLGSRPKSITKSRHPPSDQIHQLWQIFVDNVDPLTKILHVPTLRPAIQKAASHVETIPRSFEALMFAIYVAAVMSLKDDECRQRFNESRKTLLGRYISATEASLARAKFMGTTSLVVLQALVLYLLSVRDIYEPRAVWSLNGVALRIAHGMGMERDGVFLGLPIFETEMRRRLWWVLKTHDFRTAELCGLSKFRDLDTGPETTKSPTNVNDDQLYPSMSSLPAESNKLTDVVFIALRYELVNFASGRVASFRQQGKNSSLWDLHLAGGDAGEINKAFKDVEEILEMKYLRYCDPCQPLHLLTMVMARSALNLIRFLTRHPRRWASLEETPPSERQWILDISLKLLEQYDMVQSNPLLKRFAWHSAYFLHWHSLIHILDTVRANPLIPEAERAWQLVGNTYANNQDMVVGTRKPINVAVGNLCLKAYTAREGALQSANIRSPPAPQYILQLRQQREAAKAKKQARDAKGSQAGNLVSRSQANSHDLGPAPDASVIYPNNSLEAVYHEQGTASNQLGPAPPGGVAEGDPFWFINGFNEGQAGNASGVMDMDPDIMLAQDNVAEDSASHTINWEQWDAWLANSNQLRPLSSGWDLGADT